MDMWIVDKFARTNLSWSYSSTIVRSISELEREVLQIADLEESVSASPVQEK